MLHKDKDVMKERNAPLTLRSVTSYSFSRLAKKCFDASSLNDDITNNDMQETGDSEKL